MKRLFRMKKLFLITAFLILTCSNLCGRFLMNALAEEAPAREQRYYTCVEIQEGDSLWTIAEQYAPDSGFSTDEYVEVLKDINGIREDVIHWGRYLTVMYTEQQH